MKHPRSLFVSTLVAAGLALCLADRPAAAQETTRAGARGFGLGYAAMLTGPDGLSLAYDFGTFHLDSLIDIWSHDRTALALAGRGWIHLHSMSAADFSVGGGIGFTKDNPSGMDEQTILHLEAGFLIRAFLVPNVAVSAFAGLGLMSGDVPSSEAEWQLDAQPLASIGLIYYFR